jgi:hypothetical protein
MARENQGLQIALIVFVMLTLILGVTTFVFYRQYDEKFNAAAAATAERDKVKQDLGNAQSEIAELKRVLGFQPSATPQVIGEEVLKDMQVTAAKGLPEADRVYRKLVQHLNDTVQKKNLALAVAENDKAQLQKQLADRESDANKRIQQHEEEVKKANADILLVTGNFKKEAEGLNSEKDKLLTERKEIEDKGNKKIVTLQTSLAEQAKKTGTAVIIAEKMRDQLYAVTKQTFETAYGKIQWVNQRTGRVFVNLGEADGLRRLTTFGVYTSATDDVTQVQAKASIEVIEIMGPHMAEARITDDKPGNPVVPGDLVFTPIWAPGKRIHFALTGLIDIDHDGKSDLERVRSIISNNGAVVDAYQDTTGKVVGEITPETTYLVVGTAPDEKSPKDMRKGNTKLIDDATKNVVKQIKIDELLQRMGYHDTDHVTRYGPGANPADFRPKAPPEGLRTSGGTVNPLFQPRQPQRGSRTTY